MSADSFRGNNLENLLMSFFKKPLEIEVRRGEHKMGTQVIKFSPHPPSRGKHTEVNGLNRTENRCIYSYRVLKFLRTLWFITLPSLEFFSNLENVV